MKRLSTIYKLTVLLALVSTAPLIFLVYNRSVESLRVQTQFRLSACQQLALSCSMHLRDSDYFSIGQQMEEFVKQTAGIGAIQLRRFDGLIIHTAGSAAYDWQQQIGDDSTTSRILIPILRDNRKWGELESRFNDDLAQSQIAQCAKALLLTLSLNLLTFGLLLRRSLAELNASKAVPRRVRNTLDTIVGGVVILDPKGRIVMSNEAFQLSCGVDAKSIIGKTLDVVDFVRTDERFPWDAAIGTKRRQTGATVEFRDTYGQLHSFVVNATPVFDGTDKLSGSLVSFEDVTRLEDQKRSLIKTLNELESSKEEIRVKNIQLQELASMDALTGCFNRRSLFEELENGWENWLQTGNPFNCIMLDVDHFKKLNDNYGHSVGDEVLKGVARTLKATAQAPAIVGRYGGEEFCVIVPGMAVEKALEIGEQIRHAIATQLAEPYAVTASFGVSGTELGAENFQAMLEQADQALYAAKHGGRNAVALWCPEHASPEEEAAAPVPAPASNFNPISYHAVSSLHAALAYRDVDTALHSQRVAEMSVALGRDLMPVSQLYTLEVAALLHDIGKLGVPDRVLLKPGSLDPAEWKIMETHAQIGVEIVNGSFGSEALSEIVGYHHYRFDGSNVPDGGPVGADIPLGARIVCIVDAFDAMVSDRVYRKARTPDEAFVELRRCAGSQFDPELVERFIQLRIGWSVAQDDGRAQIEDKLAIAIGQLTESTMHAFESRDTKQLFELLDNLCTTGDQFEMPVVRKLAKALKESIAQSRTGDWDESLPVLQELLEMCLTVQRAHIYSVGARSQIYENGAKLA